MGVSKYFLVLLLCANCLCFFDNYQNRPRIKIQNGHMVFVVPKYRNITFQTSATSGVYINHVDVLSTLRKADNVTKLTDGYRHTMSVYNDRLMLMEQRLKDGFLGSANTSTASSLQQARITTLTRRIAALNRRFNLLLTRINLNECADNPCKNGGLCIDLFNSYQCLCKDGWEGENCDEDVNECARFQGTDLGCQNGARCNNLPGSYECVCTAGFVGLHCTSRKADCTISGTELCGHGTCVPQNTVQGYKCICDQGWKSDSSNGACTIDVDECNQNHPACSKNPPVSCVNVPGSFYCAPCPQGFTGNGYHCSDIDECLTNNGGCSQNPTVTCINTHGSRVCGLCPPGYSGDGVTCTYMGVCNVNNGGCHPMATCIGNPAISSTYVECICPRGYVGNGKGPNGCAYSATVAHPCLSQPCKNRGVCTASATNMDGYQCACPAGYTGRNCEVPAGDPCALNPCLNGGTCAGSNRAGSDPYQCQCLPGFSGARCENQLSTCGQTFRQSNGTLKFPSDGFSDWRSNLVCEWVISAPSGDQLLNIAFKKFDILNSVGCRDVWLEIYQGNSINSPLLGKYCGQTLPLSGHFQSTSDSVLLKMVSSIPTQHVNFELSWSTVRSPCGGLIRFPTMGTIRYPEGNQTLSGDCTWNLIAGMNKRISLTLVYLQIGNSSDCTGSYIEFSSRSLTSGNQVMRKICNSTHQEPFTSPGSQVFVHYYAGATAKQQQFQIVYHTVEGCGRTFTNDTGVIEPPKTIQDNMLCEYKIELPVNSVIDLTFVNPIDENFCDSQRIELRDGPDEGSPLVGRYCGSNTPKTYLSNGNQLYIAGTTGPEITRWKITYERVNGRIFSAASGSFPVSPVFHEESINYYQIRQPSGYVILARFKIPDTNIFKNKCVIKISEDGSKYHSIQGENCEDKSPSVTSSHNNLWIKITLPRLLPSTYSYRQYGVNDEKVIVEYSSINIGCGGIMKSTFGTIASPTHSDGLYRRSVTCTWLLMAPSDHVIQLSWNTFNLEHSYECSYDNVMVFDNSTDMGEGQLLGKFCGFNLPPILLSTSNLMTVVFNSDLTVSMDGFLASYIFIHESKVCGGNYFTSFGVLKSPNYPRPYPTSRECAWTINVPPGQQILLNVTDFDVEYFAECRYDVVEIRNGGTSYSPLIGKYCGTKIPKLIPSHTNKLYISFKSDLNRNGRGFRMEWTSAATGCGGTVTSPSGSITSPQYPEPYSRNTECLWKIVTSAGSFIQVIFADIQLEKQYTCDSDYVELFDGDSTNTRSLGRYCHNNKQAVKSTGHQMLVKFRSDVAFQGRGFQLHYTTVCRNSVQGYYGVIESPNFPNQYEQDTDCEWEIVVPMQNKINITFSHFDLEMLATWDNKSCGLDYVEVKYEDPSTASEESPTFETYGKYCGNNNPGHLSINSNHVKIHFSSDGLIQGNGFRLEWELFGCGGHIKKKSGTISSPNYPQPYPASVQCDWLIEVDYGFGVEIEFHDVDIERDSSCQFDHISIYNGVDDTYNQLAKICHQKKKSLISTSGNFMFVRFVSDYSYQGSGFTANFSAVETKCGGTFTTADGWIYSPNYPKNYNVNDTCFWLIDSDENHAIDLTFEDFDLLHSINCSENYVKVYDGPNEAYPLLATFCGSEKPNVTIHSTYNNMFIEFRTKASVTTKGFSARYRKSCGAILKDTSGIIKIDEFEFKDYHDNCSWTIKSPDLSKHVSLTITHMEGDLYCSDEDPQPVEIYNGDSTAAPRIDGYCGSKIPPTIVSDGSSLTISINTPLTFFATYSIYDNHCGGSLTSSDGYFASPGYPKSYPVKTQCEWTLNVAPGNTITLNFIDFDLLKSDNCTTDFLEIRKQNATGALMGVYCGADPPSNITHVGSLWILLKTSDLMEGETSIPSKGFKAEYTLNFDNELSGPRGEIFSPLYPNIFKRYGTFTWKITVQTTRRIMLTFNEFYMDTVDADDTECFYSKMQIYDGADDTSNLLGLYCGLRKIDPIRSTSNVMFIRAEYGMSRLGTRFKLEWSEVFISFLISPTAPPSINGTSECGQAIVIDKDPYPFHSPGYPNGYKHNMKCDWTFFSKVGTHMRISFTDVNFAQYHGYFQDRCQYGDLVKLYRRQAEDDDWKQFAMVCMKKASENWFESTNMMKVEFVTTRFLNGTGFAANVVPVCGGTLSGPTSYILFDNSTVRGQECQWNITARSTRTLKVTVENINIPHDSTRGCNNYLLIRNGKFADSPLLGDGKYCGNAVPTPVTSTSNNLYVKYLGPLSSSFMVKFQEVKSSYGGTIELTRFDPSTVISSPNYPNVPKSHIEVDWLIIAPPGESLRIDFEGRFDLTRTENCKVEYVEVRDGATERSRLIGRYCSSSPPDSQFTTDNMMFVRFFTDTDDPKNGFKANVSINRCGGTYRGKEGFIRYSEDKAQRANCTWNLIAPRDHYLTLTFPEFNINKGNCNNHVEISEPFNVSDSHRFKYCGPDKPETFTSLGNRVIVKYLAKTYGKFAIKFEANQTACGGSLNQESGIIQSPGYPVMNHRARMCIWTITVPEGRRISLEFMDLDMDVENILENGLVVAEGDRFAIILFNYRINKTSHSIQSSSNKMSILYLSDSASSHRGFKARFTSNEPTICEGKFSDARGVLSTPSTKNHTYYCQWSHNQGELDTKHTLVMTINIVVKSTVKDTTCLRPYHTIAIYNEDNEELARICETIKEPLVILSPFLKTLVVASSRVEMNFSISYNTYQCGGMLLGERGELKTPNYPLPPTSAVYCSWLIRTPSEQTINLTSADVRLGEDCQKSYLTVFNGKLPTDPKIGKFCGNQPIDVLSQSNYLLLEYKWEPGSTGTGLRLKYEAMSSGCGGTFHDRSRIIHSPNYGSEDYPANAECLWEINAEPGYFVKLDFLDRFHIEESVNCQNDFIEIFDWKDDTWVSTGKKCGRTAPTDIHSTSQRMRILFRSNGQISGSGFKAQWVWHCGGTFKAAKAEHDIVSPGYPLRYSNGLTCIYNIISEGNINIVFRDFELEDGPTDCRYDNLTIATNYRIRRDMKTSCGKNIPPPMTIYKNAQIIFKTDAYRTAKGFKFSYFDHSCGGNVTEETDIEYNFVSLNGFGPPTVYGRRLCEWKITAPTNKIVVLNILSLSTATPPMCFSQYLDVYDSPKDRLARLCGTIEGRTPIFSTSNSMIVRLNPGWRSFKTFKAAVKFVYGPSSGCGGTLRVTTSAQYIQPPNLEDLHCFWRIWAPRDHQIVIDFTEQNLPSRCVIGNETLTACDCASIEVRDGGGPFSNLLERVCSNQTGSVVRTVAQVAFVAFRLVGKKENAFKISVKAETSVCGELMFNATSANQVLTTPGYPSSYPPVKCLYHFVAPGALDKVVLHFEDFDLTPEEKPQGHEHLTRCRGDKVEIVEDTNDNMMWQGFGNMSSFKGSSSSAYLSFYGEMSKHTFCGKDEKPFDYFSTTNSVSLFVIPGKDAVTKRGRGLKIEYSIAGCNRNYTDLTGRLSNGNGKSDCAISIVVPENRTISLYFNLFFMFRSANCTDAFFLVRDGSPEGPVLLRTCGYRMPEPVFSFTNRLYIHVKNKDLNRLLVRYDLNYVSTDKGRGCGGEIYGYRGKVFSPLYPNAFKNNTGCTWVIKVPVGLHAALKIMRFEIQGGCADNYLSVMTYTLDADGQPSPLTTKFCSGDNPAILRSESLIRITYKSSVANGGSGWYAIYQGLRAGITDLH